MTAALQIEHPFALWGFALAAPIVLFHLYHRRRVQLVVPFIGLIRESLGPSRQAARFKKLREVAALVARLLALAALVLALSGLRPADAETRPSDLMVVVDADVTTNTLEADGRLRFVHGLDLAAAWVRHHAAGRVGVVLAADPAVVLSEPDDDAGAVVRKIAAVRARFTGEPIPGRLNVAVGQVPAPSTTDLRAAVRTAMDAATARGQGGVVVVSARAFEPAPELASDIQVFGAGEARHDQGIIDFHVTPPSDTPRFHARVRVLNAAAADVTRSLRVDLGGERIVDVPLEIPAGEAVEQVFEGTVPTAGAWLAVSLAGADAFERNDAVTAWLMPPPRPSVLWVHGDQKRLSTLLVLEGLGESIDWERSGLVHAKDLASAEPRDITIVDGVPVAKGALHPGAWLFLAPSSGDLPFEVGPVIEEPLVWRTEIGHPLVRWLDFAPAHIRRGVSLSGEGLLPLAYADGKAVIAEGERDGVRFVALGLDPDHSLAPVQAALPLFLRRAIWRLVEAPRRPLEAFYRSGQALRPRAPLPGGPEATVSWESGAGGSAAGVGGRDHARVAPGDAGFRVPAGAHGTALVFTGAEDAPTWQGRTAFVDIDPNRTIAPARPPGEAPPARTVSPSDQGKWWRALVVAALLFLLLDLALLSPRRT